MSLGNLLGSLIDKEKAITGSIQNVIEDVAEELSCKPKDIFIMIKPTGNNFDFTVYLYKIKQESAPICVRVMQMSEFTDD
tara:strand:- start:513 stop:752 length:240 start_codon:yes stop_codon:yes gene_type:complete